MTERQIRREMERKQDIEMAIRAIKNSRVWNAEMTEEQKERFLRILKFEPVMSLWREEKEVGNRYNTVTLAFRMYAAGLGIKDCDV